jgi:histidinol-phosphate phosphatase family protein
LKRRAAFLDRDGTIIVDPGYLKSAADVELLPGAVEGLRTLAELGYALVVISNRAGVGRGLISPAEAKAVHDAFVDQLRSHGVQLAGAYYCDHAPWDGCHCRKPGFAMVEQAIRELDLDVDRSIMIGNRPEDLDAGRGAGCRVAYLLRTDDALASWTDVLATERLNTMDPP